MIFDHISYDLKMLPDIFTNFYQANETWRALFEFGKQFNDGTLREAGHYAFASVFMLLTGVSCALTRSNLRRGLELVFAALSLSYVMYAASEVSGIDVNVVFGILHVMACGILLYALIRACTKRKIWFLIAGSLIVLVGILIEWYDSPYVDEIDGDFFQIVAGIKKYGSDYFAFFPCVGMVLIGGYIGNAFYRPKQSLLPRLDGIWNRPVCWFGRHTLLIYLLHQFVILGAIVTAGALTGLKFIL